MKSVRLDRKIGQMVMKSCSAVHKQHVRATHPEVCQGLQPKERTDLMMNERGSREIAAKISQAGRGDVTPADEGGQFPYAACSVPTSVDSSDSLESKQYPEWWNRYTQRA